MVRPGPAVIRLFLHFSFSANGVQTLLESFRRDPQRMHVCSDNILTETAIHFDYNRASEARLSHDEVITLDPRLHAAVELADIAKLFPRDLSHAGALTNRAA